MTKTCKTCLYRPVHAKEECKYCYSRRWHKKKREANPEYFNDLNTKSFFKRRTECGMPVDAPKYSVHSKAVLERKKHKELKLAKEIFCKHGYTIITLRNNEAEYLPAEYLPADIRGNG